MRFCLTVPLCVALATSVAEAQLLPGFDFASRQFRLEQLSENHVRLIDEVEIDVGTYQFYADQVDIFTNESRLVATGNVVYTTGGSRIAADRAEFDYEHLTGAFYNATGSVNLGADADVERSMFGTQEPDMHFYGEIIEKLGPRKYRLTKGGFTSCIQPTPRWELTASSVTLNLDEYAALKNSVLEVKGVPVFYLPIMYYPIQEDDRATGFLMPMYGASTFRGQSLSNAFFWAISRSQDATIFHDRFSQTGQGIGGEYRYILGQGSEGFARTYFLNERATDLVNGGGKTTTPARRSYELRGRARHQIATGWSARGQVDYFSDITVQQTYHNNIFEASSRNRSFSGNVAGRWRDYQLSSTIDVNETFFGESQSTQWGAGPRISFGRGKTAIPQTPIYFSFGSEYARLLRRSTFTQGGQAHAVNSGLHRFDVNPVIQIPFTRWPFLTVNSAAAWRATYWSESMDPTSRRQVPHGISRTYLDLQFQITGPTFVKVWDTPNSNYAERMKHVIEPLITLQRISAIDNVAEIVQLESIDSIVGSVTQVRYSINNRIYAKRREGGPQGVPREILNVAVMQSYYTDPLAAQFDRRFRTSFNRTPPSHVSPVSLIVRAQPTQATSGTMRAEYDTQFGALRSIGAEGRYERGGWLDTRAGWSQRRFVEGLQGFDNPQQLDHYLNAFISLRTRDNTLGGMYTFNYDILRGRYLQQRLVMYYNAQCCGVSAEYQNFNFEGLGSRARVPRDRRFNISFTLAGLGTFANVFGVFGAGGIQ